MVAAYLIAIASATMGQTADLTYSDAISDGLQYPGRLASAPGGGVYVVDEPMDQVLEFANTGSGWVNVDTFPIPEGPVGIAVGTDGLVFISRRDGMVGVYEADFTSHIAHPTLDPSPDTSLISPHDLAVNSLTGEIYVVDARGDETVGQRIVVFDGTTLAFARMWGMEGSESGEFETPQAIAINANADLVYIADVDNYRMQVYNTAGVRQYGFGDRILYIPGDAQNPGDVEVAWFARSEGLAVDACGNLYVSDALMGTVRIFDALGEELDVDHAAAIGYGTNPGELRVPCDLLIAGGQLFVASTNNSVVEVYDIACTIPAVAAVGSRRGDLPAVSGARAKRSSANEKRSHNPSSPDNPFDIVEAMDSGNYSRSLDLNSDRWVDVDDLEIAIEGFGGVVAADFLGGDDNGGVATTFTAPHVLDIPIACGRCHSMDGVPGGTPEVDAMLTVEGQENLCLSCHSSGGIAHTKPIPGIEKGLAHPRGVSATSGGVRGPDPDSLSEMALHLDGGDIRCGTCHDPMTDDQGSPYLRASLGDADLCGECHVQGDQWLHAGHSDADSRAFNYNIGRTSCAKCHSGNGFIDYTNGVDAGDLRSDKQVHSCFVCHAVHGTDEHHLLRTGEEVTLPGGHEIDAGESALCMECHNGRYAPNTGHLTPHYLLGGVVLYGKNGITFGNTIDMTPHAALTDCVGCHMAPGPGPGEQGENKIGGHSLNMVVHDPADPDYGVNNASRACFPCHTLTTVNRPATNDYDGSGLKQGIQDEVQGLLDIVLTAIEEEGGEYLGSYPYWYTKKCSGGADDGLGCQRDSNCDGVGTCVAPPNEQLLKDAIWNYELIDNDASLGVHNAGFCVGLLQSTYRELKSADIPSAFLRYSYGPDARRGGLLYDKWWTVNGAAEPTGDHPLYTGGKTGSTTFRCKECHGWDYIGDLGRYESGSHYTGIPGILGAVGWADQDLFDILWDDPGTTPNGHDFGTYGLTTFDIVDLIEFIKNEVVDTSPYINRLGASPAYTYDFIGDVGNGFGYFSAALNESTGCYVCHGNDGRTIEFHAGEFLGTLANDNPQEVLHKIRFGQPGTAMPSFVALSLTAGDAADVGAYAETLPLAAAVGGDTVRGGLLYDKWWKVNGAAEPTGDHPLYSTGAGTKTGNTTFRCKECHGWDYKGAAGAYATGSHYTGFTGIIGTTMNQAELETFLATGVYPDTSVVADHVMADLTATDIEDLAAFIDNELIDTDVYINFATKAFIGTASPDGADLYDGTTDPVSNCALCHGADGTAIDFGGEFLGGLADGNPWETLHKIRFGQPAAGMCSYVRLGLSDAQAADVGAFAQTLP